MTNHEHEEYLRKNLKMLANAKIGFFYLAPTDIQNIPNQYVEKVKGLRDYHFSVCLPYASKKLNWEIIFDPENLSEVPDFNFNDHSFLAEPDIDFITENIPSWDIWNIVDSNALLNILKEFLILFKKCQLEKLFRQNMYAHIRQEYEDLLSLNGIREENIEVLIESRNNVDLLDKECGCITFLIYLPIDFSKLPEYYQEELEQEDLLNPGADYAFIQVQMRKLDRSQIQFALQLSPRADQLMGKVKFPKPPKNVSLGEYVQSFQKAIENQIETIVDQYHKKNLFISTVVNIFSSSVLEYNNRLFNKIVFIFEEYEEYDCMVTITLGLKFPQERPKILLSSIYCQAGKSCKKELNYDYSATFGVDEMIQIIVDTLKEEVKSFQNHEH